MNCHLDFTNTDSCKCIISSLVLCAISALCAHAQSSDAIGYNRDVRPILANSCFPCHGPDGNTREANLRLDIRDVAIADRDGVLAIVPGDPSASELVRRITHADPDKRMPPAESPRQITDRDIAILTEWIEQGAKYEGHWAYVPPKTPEPPAVNDDSWNHNPIDRFVRRTLASKGLAPSPPADKTTLIRRAYFDLVGLPPTRAEAQSALDDSSAHWFEHLVDRLLDSPHYGERMAVEWLDLVRYADSNGYHSDETRSMWPYRDYVIDAFNRNKRFDDFTIEQLAGDLLPDARTEQIIASGYNRLNQITAEGGAQAKEYLAMYAADRVRTTSSVWLGSTMGCAECHDHKFDPFTMRDFYGMAAYFADIEEPGVYPGRTRWEPVLALPTLEEQVEERQLRAELEAESARLEMPDADLEAGRSRWAAAQMIGLGFKADPGWLSARPENVVSEGGATLTVLEDAAVISGGDNPVAETYVVDLRTNRMNITGLRIEVLPDTSFKKGLARDADVVALMEIEVRADSNDGERIPIGRAEATAFMPDYPVDRAIDGDLGTGWAVTSANKEDAVPVTATFEFETPVRGGADTRLNVRLVHANSVVQKAAFGKFRISLTSDDVRLDESVAPPEDVIDAIFQEAASRTAEATDALNRYYRHISPELAEIRSTIAGLNAELTALTSNYTVTLVTKSTAPRTMRILPRGNWMDDSGDVVVPAAPEFLAGGPPKNRRATRLDLAQWLIDRDNPLTARVFVNRIWKRFFGTGLSKVLDDLGAQGEWPTHPELLDWLAVEFMDSGWDVKHIVRLIVTSEAYRQSSALRPELAETDPYNRLLARQTRFRFDAEFVRDNALAVSGLLVRDIGGRSVRPYQPKGYYAHMNFPKREYEVDSGDHLYRRGVYTHWQRSFLHPSLLAFDAPSREECTAQRAVSNTPQQALVLLNDPIYVEAARSLAERIIREGGESTPDRVAWALHETLTRPADDGEIQVLTLLMADHFEYFTANPDEASRALHIGARRVPTDIPAPELAAWTSVARAILNLHETITRT